MAKKFIIKDASKKGKGLFALRDFRKGEIILRNDTTKLKRYSLKEIGEDPELSKVSNHADYIGHWKYVIDFSPGSYINHSCEPNAYVEFRRLGIAEVIALRPIKKGEEITVDGALSAVDQIRGAYPNKDIHYWKERCYCGSRNCRKVMQGDFFQLPKRIKIEKLAYLPTWMKRKYRDRIRKIRESGGR